MQQLLVGFASTPQYFKVIVAKVYVGCSPLYSEDYREVSSLFRGEIEEYILTYG